MTNTRLLKATILMHGDTIRGIAEEEGMRRSNLSQKINNRAPFKQIEMEMFIRRYRLTGEQVINLFFGGAV